LRRFRTYLQNIPFKIITDCNALVMTLNKKDIQPRIARWVALESQNFKYSTEHRSEKRMQHDILSRANDILVVDTNTFKFELSACQMQDPIYKLRAHLDRIIYEMRNGLVYRKQGNYVSFFVLRAMELDLIHKYHNEWTLRSRQHCSAIARNVLISI